MDTTPVVGQRRSYDGALCTVRYVGEVARTAGGAWLGVEWDDPRRGKHDGVHKGVRYFSCRPRQGTQGAPLTPASFVRPTRPADRPRTFLEAVRAKYASEATETADGSGGRQVVISGKVAEEVGFDKARRQLAQIETLRVVILDGMCVTSAAEDGESMPKSIRETCPRIRELDLSRNLFTHFRTVADICRELPELRSLRVNGNFFQVDNEIFAGAFGGVRELYLEETFLSWEQVGQVVASFPVLASLSASSNQLSTLSPPLLPTASHLSSTLTTLNLEFNDFTALSDLATLTELRTLRNLHLKGCSITSATAEPASSSSTSQALVFSPTLHYVDLSYNRVATWAFVDALPDIFPGLDSLRFAHNPIYDNPNLDSNQAATTTSISQTTTTNADTTASTEESYMIAVGRLAGLRTLNFGAISPTDRANAEMFYLSRIAKQLASVPEGSLEEAAVVARHRRYAELCELYGEPAVVRHAAVNPAFLEARLIRVLFCLEDKRTVDEKAQAGTTSTSQQKSVEIPKSFDMYAVKGIAGRLFGGVAPQRLRLVWETGEWDPVVGVDDDEEEQDDEDAIDVEAAAEAAQLAAERAQEDQEMTDELHEVNDDGTQNGHQEGGHTGRWVEREVELKDSPRQFGFCVDGMEARIRVEIR